MSKWDTPPPPREARPPPRIELSSCLRAALVALCCRALHCRHVYCAHSYERPVGCSFPLFSHAFLFSLFTFCWDILSKILSKTKRFRFTIYDYDPVKAERYGTTILNNQIFPFLPIQSNFTRGEPKIGNSVERNCPSSLPGVSNAPGYYYRGSL